MNIQHDIPLRTSRNQLLHVLFSSTQEFSALLPLNHTHNFLKISYLGDSNNPKIQLQQSARNTGESVDFDAKKMPGQLIITLPKATEIGEIFRAWNARVAIPEEEAFSIDFVYPVVTPSGLLKFKENQEGVFSTQIPTSIPNAFIQILYNGTSHNSLVEVIHDPKLAENVKVSVDISEKNATGETGITGQTSTEERLIIKIKDIQTTADVIISAWEAKKATGADDFLMEFIYPQSMVSPPATISLEIVKEGQYTIAPTDPVHAYPIRDLPICYIPNIDLDAFGIILVIGVEKVEEVKYVLLDENGNRVEVTSTGETGLTEANGILFDLEKKDDFDAFLQVFSETSQIGWQVITNGPAGPSLTVLKHALDDKFLLEKWIDAFEEEEELSLEEIKETFGKNASLIAFIDRLGLPEDSSLQALKDTLDETGSTFRNFITALSDSLSLKSFRTDVDSVNGQNEFLTNDFQNNLAKTFTDSLPKFSDNFKKDWKRVLQLTTPPIGQDTTYTILASKLIKTTGKYLEEELITAVRFHPKINEKLFVSFTDPDNPENELGKEIIVNPDGTIELPRGTRTVIDSERITNNNNSIDVKIINVQKNVVYELTGLPEGAKTSQQILGQDRLITISELTSLRKDTILAIKASRKAANNVPFEDAYLEQKLNLVVTIHPNVLFVFDTTGQEAAASTIQAFNETPQIRIVDAQQDVKYQLFAYTLQASYSFETGAEYTPEGIFKQSLEDALSTARDNGRLKPLYAFENGLPVDQSGEDFRLTEDCLLVIKATKATKNNQVLERWLTKHLTVLVLPDPDLIITRIEETGEPIRIRLENAQKGVGYQLKEAFTDGEEVGPTLLTGAYQIGWRGRTGMAAGRRFGMQLSPGREEESPNRQPGNYFRIRDDNGQARATGTKGETSTELGNNILEFTLPQQDVEITYEIIAIKEYTGLSETLTETITKPGI